MITVVVFPDSSFFFIKAKVSSRQEIVAALKAMPEYNEILSKVRFDLFVMVFYFICVAIPPQQHR